MNLPFEWPAKRWLLSLPGVLLLSLLIWYLGPLLVLDGYEPMALEARRWGMIGLMLFIWVAGVSWEFFRIRRANHRLIAAMSDTKHSARSGTKESAAIVAALSKRMHQAMAILRQADSGKKLSGQYLYKLPWYLVIGAPGSGKTAAITHSGLQFPLGDSVGSAGSVGGMRHCDWWFTDEAVLLDTVGRYTVQDRYSQADKVAWDGFLGLLKKNRPLRPINGLIITLSASDLLEQRDTEHQVQSIRARINELHERLGLRFPVYVMITKCDLLAGFAEFFESLGREDRSQAWGITFALEQSDGADQLRTALATLPAEFNALEGQLLARVLARVQQEPDLVRRALLYNFPQQFSHVAQAIEQCLMTLFMPSTYQEATLLRGIYLTSSLQEGLSIDSVRNAQVTTFGLHLTATRSAAVTSRSYFITRLMREVIFKEAGLAGITLKEKHRRRFVQRTSLTIIGVVTLVLAAATTISYRRNLQFVDQAASGATAVAQLAQDLSNTDSLQLARLLPLLDAARDLPGGFAASASDLSLYNRLGLYQGFKLGRGARYLYQRILRNSLLPEIVNNMEQVLRERDASNDDFLYETLRVYLMLGQRQRFDASSVQAWVDLAWRLKPPQQTDEPQRRQLLAHVSALLDAYPEMSEPMQLDATLITQVRTALSALPISQRIYQRSKRQVRQLQLPEWTINGATGRDVSTVLTRKSGASLSQGISGLYRIAGYRELLVKGRQIATDMAKDKWVLNPNEPSIALADSDAMMEAMLELYFADYIREWETLLADVRPVPLTSLDQASLVTSALAAGDSPLRLILQAVARETRLEGVLAPEMNRPDVPIASKLDEAQKKLLSAVGNAPLEMALPPNNPVDRHFAPLMLAVSGEASSAAIDKAFALLTDTAQYFDHAQTARLNGTLLPSTAVWARLEQASSAQPAPLSTALHEIASSGAVLANGDERTYLNAQWAASGESFCRDAIAGRYPLVRNASREISGDDFARFFGAGGVMDAFFEKHLKSQVDTSGKQWRWRATALPLLNFSQKTLNQFQYAARLREMFFVDGNAQLSMRFDLRVLKANAFWSTVNLTVGNQSLGYEAGGTNAFTSFFLPSNKGNREVRLSVGETTDALHSEGPWAWLRMIDKGRLVTTTNGNYRLTFNLGGRELAYELRPSSVINPFQRETLEKFRCPQGF